MKKVGILTFHRAQNYGAVLQCYALQEALKSVGYVVYVIDYRCPEIENAYKVFEVSHLCDLRKCIKSFLHFPLLIARRQSFSSFIKKYLHLTSSCTNGRSIPGMDIYVIGSDQVWSLSDDVYWGRFQRPLESKLYGYALSANIDSLKQTDNKELLSSIQNFELLSFRETDIRDYIERRTGERIRIDVDPTLLLDKSRWGVFAGNPVVNGDYVLLYQVRFPKNGIDLLRHKVKALAQQLNCKVVDASFASKYSPIEFVSLIKYAKYVVTTSFHGTAFSLIFEKPLYSVMLHDGHDDRYKNLLRSVDADAMLVDEDFIPVPKDINYDKIRLNLEKYKKMSLAYLKSFDDNL